MNIREFYDDDETLGRIPTFEKIQFTRVRTIKKSRISSKCEFCEYIIKKGDGCEYWSGIDLGKFFYYRVCSNCMKINIGEKIFEV